MGSLLSALLELQSVERQLRQVQARRRRLTRSANQQQRKVEDLRAQEAQVHEALNERRRQADRASLEVRTAEEQVSHLRDSLNSAKTNKEYAAILTQLNTVKADNAKREEEALNIMQAVEETQQQLDQFQQQIAHEQQRLEHITAETAEEVKRLEGMLEELHGKRDQAAANVPEEQRRIFDRVAENYDGEAMAVVEKHGNKPPHDYVCGGCFMSINAEHVNALQVRDEVRRCDSCGRILYIETQAQSAPTQ